MFQKIKEWLSPQRKIVMTKFYKVRAKFKLIDGTEHYSAVYNWIAEDSITISIGEFITSRVIQRDKRILGENNDIYPLHAIVSLEWEVVKETVICHKEKFSGDEDYFKTFFTDEELKDLSIPNVCL